MENSKETFEYTYSAEQQAEIEKIRSKYLPKEDNKLEQLRKLDSSVTMKGTMIGIIVGVAGCLVFGLGLTFVLLGGMEMLLPGVFVGSIGIVVMIAAYLFLKRL